MRAQPSAANASPPAELSLDAWIASGQRDKVTLASGTFEVFRRISGNGDWLTLLHGFPSSSWDWVKVAPLLEPHRRLLAFDFLGFGASDKPAGHAYSLREQADLTEHLWREHGVRKTALLVHDIGLSVAKELLARHREGRLAVDLTHILFTNGILYEHLHAPVLLQRLLLGPVGPLLGRLTTESIFRRQFSTVFGRGSQPTREELHQHWRAIALRDGPRNYHRLIRYIVEGREQSDRWRAALEALPVPSRFVWGSEDPVCGEPMVAELQRRVPAAEVIRMPGIGHYPPLEAPEEVARQTLALLGAVRTGPSR